MSIDRRLREGLRESADALTPDPLVALHTVERKARRQRRRILVVRLAAAAAAIVLVLVGLPLAVTQLRGPDAGSPAATPPAAPSDPVLPEGTYRTPELTREQLIATGVKAGFTRAQAEQALARDRIDQTATFTLTIERGQWTQSFNYDGIREGIGFEATYKVIDYSTVVVTETWSGDETVFEYTLEGNAIRISFKNPNPQRMCQGDTKCPMGFIVWESAPFSRV
jgi:hypothetical protein